MNETVDIKSTMALCINDLKVCCGTLFPGIFSSPFSILHDEIFRLINQSLLSGKNKIVIAAPRGIGKTSIARAIAMRGILFRLYNFIVYVSNTAGSAEMQTENMKRDLLTSQIVKNMFGSIKVKDENGMDESFSKLAWTAYGSIFVLPRGMGQQIRGINWSNFRPELVIIDDLEDAKEVRNPENRKEWKRWFKADLLKTEGRFGKRTVFIYIDTVKHEDSILAGLLESKEWASIKLAICDDNYKSFDPNYMTDEEIAAEVEEHREDGTLDEFYMERMNVPISKEDAVFQSAYFKYFTDARKYLKIDGVEYTEQNPGIRSSHLTHITLVDPARTAKLQSADSAVITVGIDRENHAIFIRDQVGRKFFPDQLYDEMFRQVKAHDSFILAIDMEGLSNFIKQPIESECRIRNIHPMIVELPSKREQKAKEIRVASLASLYRLGNIYHNKTNCAKLEGQLLAFPRSKLWDMMDCLSYVNYIMDKYTIYFNPTEGYNSEPPPEDYDDLKNDKMYDEDEMGLLI
jgi:hypothetical protein